MVKSIEEVNKGIAEFMGGPYIGDACSDSFGVNDGLSTCTTTEVCLRCEGIPTHYLSLDSLVQVWERLGSDYGVNFWKDVDRYDCRLDHIKKVGYVISKRANTPQEAAARATLKAIEAING